MKMRSKLVKKKDYLRVLLTETSPYEVPAIFSNVGFYNNMHYYNKSEEKFVLHFLFSKNINEDYTIPLSYKIKKDIDSSRTLSLIHPRSQVSIVEFYEEFSNIIVSACKKSNFSLRAPSKVSSKYFLRNNNMLDREFTKEEVQSVSDEKIYKHLASYFSYNRYTRLHKFFNSKEFLHLEKRYELFCSIDIAKCFDSIYTHSITWAVKNKEYSKNNRNVKNSFGTLFDRLMQSINYNETAGIIIGPEVSRVFAEVIFQEIDREIENTLSSLGYENDIHYTIRRYVDDIFIFSLSESINQDIKSTIDEIIKKYKLSINKQKVSISSRPFATAKTNTINELNEILNSLTSKFIDTNQPNQLKRIYSRDKTIISYLSKIKSIFVDDRDNYNLAAGYTISALINIAINIDRKIKSIDDYYNNNRNSINDFFTVAIEIILHLFFISPGHTSSVKICILTDIICSIYKEDNTGDGELIKVLIYNLSHSYFERYIDLEKDKKIKRISLESLNLLISIKQLGDEYRLSRNVISGIFSTENKGDYSYFEIITLLYYMGDDAHYNSIKAKIISTVMKMLNNITDIKSNSLKCYLFLDFINCPFVDEAKRRKLVKELLKLHFGKEPNKQQLQDGWEQLTQNYWFVQWDNLNLRLFLEKKELLSVY